MRSIIYRYDYNDYYCNGNGLATALQWSNLVMFVEWEHLPLPPLTKKLFIYIMKPLSSTFVICNLYNVSKVHV